MAYNQQNNNQKSTNTRSATMVNKKTKLEPILLITSFWDDMMKIQFCPQLPEGQRTENKQFDRENAILTCVSRDKCNELVRLYEEQILPKLKDEAAEKLPFSVSIPIADVNQLALGISVDENGEYQTYLELIKNIDPETLKSNNVVRFEFPKGEYIVNYDPAEGTFKDRILTHNGIDVFVKDMGDFRSASSKAYVHAARCVDRTYKDMVYGGIVAIGEKVGANIQTNGTGNSHYGRTGGQNPFDRAGNNAPLNIPSMGLDDLEAALAEAEGTFVS